MYDLGSSMIDRAPTIQDFIIALAFHCAGLLYSGYLFGKFLCTYFDNLSGV